VDFAVLEHGLAKHGRDYNILLEDCLGTEPGKHEIVFTHCVSVECETRLTDGAWTKSWGDEFTDYERWTAEGEPDGYARGTNWSLACPGLQVVPESAPATEWSRRLGKQMFELNLTTDRFLLQPFATATPKPMSSRLCMQSLFAASDSVQLAHKKTAQRSRVRFGGYGNLSEAVDDLKSRCWVAINQSFATP